MKTIGQAYEDMQTQNQNLLDQVIERDEYNIKVYLIFIFSKHYLTMIFTVFSWTTAIHRLFSWPLLFWLMKNIWFIFVANILTSAIMCRNICQCFEELIIHESTCKN